MVALIVADADGINAGWSAAGRDRLCRPVPVSGYYSEHEQKTYLRFDDGSMKAFDNPMPPAIRKLFRMWDAKHPNQSWHRHEILRNVFGTRLGDVRDRPRDIHGKNRAMFSEYNYPT